MIDIQHSNERNFCGAITPKEKDKIMKAILDMAAHERKTFCFTPNDVPNLRINGKQFEMVIMDFFEKDIYLGYGEYKTVAFEPSSGYPFFDNDNLLLCKWSGFVNISMMLKCSAECIAIYNLNGDLISTKYICNDGAYNCDYENAAIRYGDSIIIGKNNGYFIIDKSGNIIEENNHIHLAGFGSPDAILGRKYVLVDWDDGRTSYDGMSIFDLDKGRYHSWYHTWYHIYRN